MILTDQEARHVARRVASVLGIDFGGDLLARVRDRALELPAPRTIEERDALLHRLAQVLGDQRDG